MPRLREKSILWGFIPGCGGGYTTGTRSETPRNPKSSVLFTCFGALSPSSRLRPRPHNDMWTGSQARTGLSELLDENNKFWVGAVSVVMTWEVK